MWYSQAEHMTITMQSRNLLFLGVSLVCLKMGYLMLTFGSVSLWGSMDDTIFRRFMARWPNEGNPVFLSHYTTWDAAHYLRLSEVGYEANLDSCAFYPLWPIFVRWGSGLTGGSHLLAGMVLANVFSLAAFVLFYQVVRKRFGAQIGKWALVLLIAFPGSLFYQFIYSEPLFMLLVMVLWWALERGRYDWAWSAALLLPLARPVGIVAVLPIAWYLATRRPVPGLGWLARWGLPRVQPREGRPGEYSMSSTPTPPFNELTSGLPDREGEASSSVRDGNCTNFAAHESELATHVVPTATWSNMWFYWLLVVPLVGWAVYLAFMWLTTGNALEGIHAQRHWGVHSASNVFNLKKFVIDMFTPTRWHGFSGSMLDRFFFILMLYTIPVMWRLDKGLLIWTYMLGVFPAMSGGFVSFTRYAAMVFPMFIAFAVFFDPKGMRWGRWMLLSGFVVMHAVLVWRFVNFRWAG